MTSQRLTLLPEPLKNVFLEWLDPLAIWLVRAGLKPNGITTLSIFVLAGSGLAWGLGELRWGAALLLFSGLLDLLDGKVARHSGAVTRFGAFYDSTMDRVGEAVLFSGIAVYVMTTSGQRWPVVGLLLCFTVLSASFLVSYARARAEGLGLDCRVGIAQRPERIVLLGVPTLIWHAGHKGYLLLGILFVLAVVETITVVQRILYVRSLTRHDEPARAAPATPAATPAPAAPGPVPVAADPVLKGS